MKDKWIVLNQIVDSFKEINRDIARHARESNIVQKSIFIFLVLFFIVGLIINTDSIFDIVVIALYTLVILILMVLAGKIIKKKVDLIFISDFVGWGVIYLYSRIVTRRMMINVSIIIISLYGIAKLLTLIKQKKELRKKRGKRILINITGIALVVLTLRIFNIPIQGMNKPEYHARKYFIGLKIPKKEIHVVESRESYQDSGIDVIIDIGDLKLLKDKKDTDSTGKKLPNILKEYIVWYDNGKIADVTKLEKEPELEKKYK